MKSLYLFEAVYLSHDISLEKKGLECGVQICSVNYFQILFRGFFFSVCRASPNDADLLGAPIDNAHYKGGKKM